MRSVKTAAIILAAGASRRLGRPKQDLVFEGQTLLERAVRTAQNADLDPVVAVVREPRWAHVLEPLGAIVLLNENADEGMATSVVTGVSWAQKHDVGGLVLMTCDQPALSAEHLRKITADPDRVTGSRYAGRVGVPAYFPATAYASLLQLQGDAGARGLLQHAFAIEDDSLALDIDTEEDLRHAREILTPKVF